VRDDATAVQLNSFGDGMEGTRWRINDNGIGYMQCVKDGTWIYLDSNRYGSVAMTNQQFPGGSWTISFVNQQEEGKPPQPNPINWKSPDDDIDWDLTLASVCALDEKFKDLPKWIRQGHDNWNIAVPGNGHYLFFYEPGTEGIASHLMQNCGLAYSVAKTIVEPGKPGDIKQPLIDVFIMKEKTELGLYAGIGFNTSEKVSKYRFDRKTGFIGLFVKSDADSLEKTFYESCLAHETTHALLHYELGDKGHKWEKTEGDHFNWFTEALAWYAGSIAYTIHKPELIGYRGSTTTSIQHLQEILKGYWLYGGTLGWTEAVRIYYDNFYRGIGGSQDRQRAMYTLMGTGFFLMNGANEDSTQKAIDYIWSKRKFHSIEDSLSRYYLKPTGQDDPDFNKDSLWKDFWNFFLQTQF
jgi:hypothetical protein